jgi:4-hydroxybenzoate polyprenyltransferase/phosphoserine phosphatase
VNAPERTTETRQEATLVVDLDGTLCRTDTLHEALLGYVARNPLRLVKVASWVREGKAAFKAHLADEVVLDPTALPLNETVLEIVRDARTAGHPTALVTAADQRQADAVAAATGLFDEVHGSKGGQNLKGSEKARFLTDRYGVGGFDYVGDSKADVPVWEAARTAITVGADDRLKRVASAANTNVVHVAPQTPRWRAVLKAMRPHQWSKNLLLFLPALAAHDLSALWPALLGFVSFCLAASSVYVLNDLVDLPADRAHPRKRNRPFASGALSTVEGLLLAGTLLVGSVVVGAIPRSPDFLAILALYLVVTFAYSLWLKRKLLVDVLTLAGLYTIRILAGGAVAGVVLSPWMLGFSMFLFLALAAVKRQAELTDQLETGRAISGRGYQVEDLPILRNMAMSSSHAAVLLLALYISSEDVQELYTRPQILWVICPLLLYWLTRMVLMTHRGYMTDDPIVFAAKDRISLLVVACCALLAIFATL